VVDGVSLVMVVDDDAVVAAVVVGIASGPLEPPPHPASRATARTTSMRFAMARTLPVAHLARALPRSPALHPTEAALLPARSWL